MIPTTKPAPPSPRTSVAPRRSVPAGRWSLASGLYLGLLSLLVAAVSGACQSTPRPVAPTPAPASPTAALGYPVEATQQPIGGPAYPAEATPILPEALPYPVDTAVPTEEVALSTPEAAAETPAVSPRPIQPAAPTGRFAAVWDKLGGTNAEIGWATSLVTNVAGADQVFEKACMLWVSTSPPRIYVLYGAQTSLQTSNTCEELSPDRATWQEFPDTFVEPTPTVRPALTPPGEAAPTVQPGLAPPPGLLAPIRGFGKVWSEHKDVRDALGWARLKEQGSRAQFQRFEHGVMVFTTNMSRVFVLYADGDKAGKWQSFQSQ